MSGDADEQIDQVGGGGIGAISAVKLILDRIDREEPVVAIPAGQRIRPGHPINRIISPIPSDHVGGRGTDEAVGAAPTVDVLDIDKDIVEFTGLSAVPGCL